MQPFLWSSLHCLEKYVKGILVLNRIDSKKIGHNVSIGIKRLKDSGKFELELSQDTVDFIKMLEDGGAQYRYNEFSQSIDPFALWSLDLAVWEIRRYCQVMDFDIYLGNGTEVNVLHAKLSQVRLAKDKREKNTVIIGGVLESIIKNKAHAARGSLIWKNLRFGTSNRKKAKIIPRSEASASELFIYPEILDEVMKYAFIPDKIVKKVQDHKNKQDAKSKGK